MARKSQVQVENLLTMFWLLVTLKLPPEYFIFRATDVCCSQPWSDVQHIAVGSS